MSSDRVIVDTIKMAQDLLRQNLLPTRHLTDAATVMRFRELIRSQAIRLALERSSDTVHAFALQQRKRDCKYEQPGIEVQHAVLPLAVDYYRLAKTK
jgi:hypothetical protein